MNTEQIDRECPECGKDRIVSRREATDVFAKADGVRRVLRAFPDGTHICTHCYAVKGAGPV